MSKDKITLLQNIFIFLGLGVVITLLVLLTTLTSLDHILSFNGSAANGAFQLMNPLTRLASGELLGRDFQFFHGAGVAIVHYPLFELFGRGLLGSEMSRWFTSIILFCISAAIFSYAWWHHVSRTSRYIKVVFSFTAIYFFSSVFAEVIIPSNSLLGVRTTFPIIIGAVILLEMPLRRYTVQCRNIGISLFDTLIGVLLAATLITGTEHGIAATLAYILFVATRHAVAVIRRTVSIKSALRSIALTLIPAGVVQSVALLLFATIISAGHPLQLLHYNLMVVPADQFWYFGAEPQGYLQLPTLLAQLADPSMYTFYVLGILSVALIWVARFHLRLLSGVQTGTVLFLGLYGLLTLSSFLGYYFPLGQLAGAMRVLILVDTLVVLAILFELAKSKHQALKYGILSLLLVFISYVTYDTLGHIRSYPVRESFADIAQNIKGDHSTLLDPSWANRIATFKPYLDAAKQNNPNYPVWSTYASLYEQSIDYIQPSTSGCDYIIHCLGDDMRSRYTQDFIAMEPELTITLRPSYFGFEEWLWGRHADFYAHLLESYSIVATNDSHILWKKTNVKNLSTSTPISLPINGSAVGLPSAKKAGSQLIKVTLTYTKHNPVQKAPIAGKLPRYLARPNNTHSSIGFSLPPDSQQWSFLVVLNSDTSINSQHLQLTASGLIPGAQVQPLSATYTPIAIDEQEASYLTEQTPF